MEDTFFLLKKDEKKSPDEITSGDSNVFRPAKEGFGSGSSGASGDPCRKRKYIKKFNADRMCGVVEPDGVHCRSTLFCNKHSVDEKRAVEGRTAPFSALYQMERETRDRKKGAGKQKREISKRICDVDGENKLLVLKYKNRPEKAEILKRTMERLKKAPAKPLAVEKVSLPTKNSECTLQQLLFFIMWELLEKKNNTEA
ncbi:MAG: uncharacterized protein A8A55_0422 [Amphiamblys sp. WSBS2006]|nr:MAG: uncharacterized protein A8A55_0422 [Amphiamblys sp. WSBS2006]